MDQLTIEREIVVAAPIDTVWNVITEPSQIQHWFGDSVELDLRPGGTGFVAWTSAGHTAPLVVQRVERPHLFSFRWVFPEGEEPTDRNSTLVTFTLVENETGTTVRLVESLHGEIAWDDERKKAFVSDHNNGWTEMVEKLGTYIASLPAGV